MTTGDVRTFGGAMPSIRTIGAGLTRGVVARLLVRSICSRLPVQVNTADRGSFGGGDADSPTLEIVRPDALYRRLEGHPKIGLGEAYMAGDWRAGPGTDLADALVPFAARMGHLLPERVLRLRVLVDRALPHHERNTLSGSRRNIEAHYDLSNDLFASFLDPTMTYSSALFDQERPLADQDLQSAQLRKIDAVLDAAGVTQGTHVLEIGTGWGELAVRAAQRGAWVTSITLSNEQCALAKEKVVAAGVADRVEIRLQDYREVSGRFDAIVSVEMIEAVGEEYWPTYFAAIDRLLRPGGRVCVQAIVMRHERYLATRRSYGWIQKYIFPGGMIPSLEAIEAVVARHTSLQVSRVHRFGLDYAETLRRWRMRFEEQWPVISAHGFDETFRRMWEFYLAYCEAGFAAGYLDVAHITLEQPAAVAQ